jgi:hypothetical protein
MKQVTVQPAVISSLMYRILIQPAGCGMRYMAGFPGRLITQAGEAGQLYYRRARYSNMPVP